MTEIYPNIILRIIFINYPDHRHHPDERATCTQFAHKAFPLENLEKGISEELYRDDIDKNIVTAIRLETLVLPFNQHVFPKSKYNLAEVNQQLMEHYLFGIASVKGHKLILKYKEERNKVKQ